MECKGLEIRPIRGGYMLTNQRRVSDDQSEPSSQNAMRGTDGIKGTVPSFLPFPHTSDTNSTYICERILESTLKTRPYHLESQPRMPILQGVIWVHSTVAPPIA